MPTLGSETRALAEDWIGDVQAIAQDMYASLAERIPVAGADPEIAAMTLASCSSNVEAILSMILADIPASAAQAPVTALEHARLMAKRGAEVNDTLRFYRLGHGFFLQRWSEDLRRRFGDPDTIVRSLQEASAFTVEYLDIVSARVSEEHLAERERRQRRAAVVRADLVRALLAEDPDDLAAAERTLGHRLDRAQLAFVCWSATSSHVERAAVAVAEALGSARPLLVPEGPEAVAAWIVPSGHGPPPERTGAEALRSAAPEVSVAFGSIGVGLEGFRTSHDEAARARRVAQLADGAPRCVTYDDVALVDLLSRDLGAARRFVRSQLGDLAGPDPAIAALRDTIRTVLAPRGGVAQAAREQDLHRNTVLQRVHRAEALRGRPLDDRPDDLYAALLLVRTVPDALRT